MPGRFTKSQSRHASDVHMGFRMGSRRGRGLPSWAGRSVDALMTNFACLRVAAGAFHDFSSAMEIERRD
jgi:hypothetical protein